MEPRRREIARLRIGNGNVVVGRGEIGPPGDDPPIQGLRLGVAALPARAAARLKRASS